jgi:hypothetical protein
MTDSATLWGDAFAPVTSAIGFLRAPLDVVVGGLTTWRRRIHGAAESKPLDGGLSVNISELEPLTSGMRPRELVVATRNPEWTAVFDCGFQGADPITTVGFLAQTLQVQGVVVVSIPDVPGGAGRPQRYGARQVEMFGPLRTHFLNYVRTISVVRETTRWRFNANGTVQEFEDTEAYKRRKVADRFTPSMLIAYADALGLRPFDEDFFPGPSVLVTNPSAPTADAIVLSLRDAQRRAGIVNIE